MASVEAVIATRWPGRHRPSDAERHAMPEMLHGPVAWVRIAWRTTRRTGPT